MGFLADDSADVPSDYTFNTNIDFIDQPIQIDFGLDDIRIGGVANSPLRTDSNVNSLIGGVQGSPVQVNSTTNLNSRVGGLDEPIAIELDMGLDNVRATVDLGLDNINACFSFAIKELPSMKVHYPVNYEFGLELLGVKLFNFCIAGKSMVITEDNPVTLFHTPHRPRPVTGTPGTVGTPRSASFNVSVVEED